MKKLALACAFLLALAGCSTAAPSPAFQSAADGDLSSSAAESTAVPSPFTAENAGQKTELIVSAAASLTDCMGELSALYKASNPDVTLTFNFGSSGALQQQIEQGAPADVFISAGKKQMSALQEKALMDDATVQDILQNRVVLIVPKGGTALADFNALTADAITQIGVGEPESVPVGQYTQEVFTSLGLTEQLTTKLVYAKDVREVLAWVESGNVQAGIVYETDANISDKVTICCAAPQDSHKPIVYPMGVVKDSKNAEAARAFTAFLATPEAAVVLESYGFTSITE